MKPGAIVGIVIGGIAMLSGFIFKLIQEIRDWQAERASARLQAMQAQAAAAHGVPVHQVQVQPTNGAHDAATPSPQGHNNVTTRGGETVAAVNLFLDGVLREKPARFSPDDLREFTRDYADRLGSGAFGVVYRGAFPNGVQVAVKVLNGTLDKRAEEQFMAEVGTAGRTYHINLVRLHGFCFDAGTKALVYEYMENGSLDRVLFEHKQQHEHAAVVGFDTLYGVVVGTARGLRYLHEECLHRIVHYDIKPGNVLLAADYTPKVADFGLARLCNRDNTHLTMTGARGTPGYAAPELWLPMPVTHKCDVYSFGMLVFEILGRRRNLEFQHPIESQEWYPKWVSQRFEQGRFDDVMAASGIQGKDGEKAERMCKVALWCVQYQPEARPSMSSVVRMLEGDEEIARPVNPFAYLDSLHTISSTSSSRDSAAASSDSSKESSHLQEVR
ncbi:hypothetical protein QOZ80_4AG0301090 [Eleusine coracana subsp. coracana]|nr:hypothetical protein QOZ80_4AG0301090 [Eleusine coracana subsp. coracana]